MGLFLKRSLIFSTFVERIRIEWGMDITVSGGIHFLIVNTVEDAKQSFMARTEQVIQFLAKVGGQDFLGIALTDSRHGVSKEDATSHKVNDIRQFWDLWVEKTVVGNTGNLQNAIAEDALVGKIVDSIDGGTGRIEGVLMVDSMQPIRHNTRMPVIAVDNIWRPVQGTHCFERGTAKQDETLSIIGIAVDILSFKITRGVNHVDWNSITYCALAHTHLDVEICHVHSHCVKHRVELEPFRINLPIAWHRQANI